MKTIRRFHAGALAAALLAATLGMACDNSYGIFNSIQDESKITGSDVFKRVGVASVVSDGTSYFARMTMVYSRPVGGGTWTLLPIGGMGKSYNSYATAAIGTAFYASVVSGSGSFAGIQKRDALVGTWSAVNTAAISAAGYSYVDALFAANGFLFAQGHHSVGTSTTSTPADTYALFWSDGTNPFVAASTPAGVSTPFTGVSFSDGQFWCSNASTVYVSATAGGAFVAGPLPAAVSPHAMSTNAAGTVLYITAGNGNAYKRPAGGPWALLAGVEGNTSIPLTDIVDLGTVAPATTMILVGTSTIGVNTSAPGYFQSTNGGAFVTDASSTISDESNYATTILDKPVNSFFWDASGMRLFACTNASGLTSGSGLYSNKFDGSSSWSGWNSE